MQNVNVNGAATSQTTAITPTVIGSTDYTSYRPYVETQGAYYAYVTKAPKKDGTMVYGINAKLLRKGFELEGDSPDGIITDGTVAIITKLVNKESAEKLDSRDVTGEIRKFRLNFHKVITPFIINGNTYKAGTLFVGENNYARNENKWGAALDDATDALDALIKQKEREERI